MTKTNIYHKKNNKKNIFNKLSVKQTFNNCDFRKKNNLFTINLCKIYTFCQKTNISIKK